MKIKTAFPPNYSEITKHFPAVENYPGVVFTYGNVLYSPGGDEISDDLMKHEETHARQQAHEGIKEWWQKYFDDVKFRIDQEIQAYRNQYQYAKKYYNRQHRRQLLRKIAKDLSGPIYGRIIDCDTAQSLITKTEL